MKFKHYPLIGILLMLLGLYLANPAVAADLAQPQAVIEEASDKLQAKLQDKAFGKDFAKLTQYVNELINPHTDFNLISSLVLGKSWKAASPSEQMGFKKEFQTLLVRTYSRAFVEFKDWKIRYLPLQMEPNAKKVVVKTEVLQPGTQPIGVNYRMALTNDGWKAYDIMIEGVSLVTNYRTTFSNEIQSKGSLSAVIDSLAKKNAEALAGK